MRTVWGCRKFDDPQISPSHCCYYDGPRTPIDAVIISAVNVESDALQAHLLPIERSSWSSETTPLGGEWNISTFHGVNDAKVRIALSQQHTMGLAAAAALTAQAIQVFRPNYVFMSGIAAGIIGKTSVGDIIVANYLSDYGAGKWKQVKNKIHFLPRPEQCPTEGYIIRRCKTLAGDADFLRTVHRSWLDLSDQNEHFGQPSIHVGPLVSGAAVINSKKMMRRIARSNDAIVGLDMEAFGVAQAVASARFGSYYPKFLIAKSVCDYGFKKEDGAQAYAAFTSARFIRKYIERYILDFEPKSSPVHFNVGDQE